MLALQRNSGEYVVIGENIIVQVVEVGNQLRLAIEAPKDVKIQRGEVYEETHTTPVCIRRNQTRADTPKTGFNRAT